jgi:hypothetical protein
VPESKKTTPAAGGRQPAPRGQSRPAGAPGLDELTGALRALLTIPGVEGVGQPVTLISPADLPPDVLGFVERLRGGPIEIDEEMLLITLAGSHGRRRKREPVVERLRQALILLSRYATDKGAFAGDVLALLDETKRRLSRQARRSKHQE